MSLPSRPCPTSRGAQQPFHAAVTAPSKTQSRLALSRKILFRQGPCQLHYHSVTIPMFCASGGWAGRSPAHLQDRDLKQITILAFAAVTGSQGRRAGLRARLRPLAWASGQVVPARQKGRAAPPCSRRPRSLVAIAEGPAFLRTASPLLFVVKKQVACGQSKGRQAPAHCRLHFDQGNSCLGLRSGSPARAPPAPLLVPREAGTQKKSDTLLKDGNHERTFGNLGSVQAREPDTSASRTV